MGSWPASRIRSAATEESTPPDMATAMRIGRKLSAVGYQLSALGGTSAGGRHDQHQCRAADRELPLVLERGLGDRLFRDERAVRRAEVDQRHLLAVDLQRRVLPGDLRVVEREV